MFERPCPNLWSQFDLILHHAGFAAGRTPAFLHFPPYMQIFCVFFFFFILKIRKLAQYLKIRKLGRRLTERVNNIVTGNILVAFCAHIYYDISPGSARSNFAFHSRVTPRGNAPPEWIQWEIREFPVFFRLSRPLSTPHRSVRTSVFLVFFFSRIFSVKMHCTGWSERVHSPSENNKSIPGSSVSRRGTPLRRLFEDREVTFSGRENNATP